MSMCLSKLVRMNNNLGLTSVSLQKNMVPDDAVETLAGSLGKRETNPEDEKPVVDKVKVMAAQMLLQNDLLTMSLCFLIS